MTLCFTVKQTARTGGAVQTGVLRKSPGPGTVRVVPHFQLTSAPIEGAASLNFQQKVEGIFFCETPNFRFS